MKYMAIFLIVFVFLACKEAEVLPMNGEVSIDEAFQPYVDQFIEEAATRGQIIDFSDTGLTMQFGIIDESKVATCLELGDDRRGSHIIEFDRTVWNISANPWREFLVFHELGHCELKRKHQNDQLPNEEWFTIMRGIDPNEPIVGNDRKRPVSFFGFRKQYYLDELFGLSPNEPEWASFTVNYNKIKDHQKETISHIVNASELRQEFDLPSTNYELEIKLNRLQAAGDIGVRYGTLKESYLFKVDKNNDLLIEWAGAIPSERQFFTDGNLNQAFPFRLFFCNLPLDNQNLKLTIQQQNGIASFFLNEKFLYHLDALESKKILVGAIQNKENLNIEYFKISAL